MEPIDLPSWADIFKFAPIASIIIGIVAVGWWARGRDKDEHIKTLKDLIEYLKRER